MFNKRDYNATIIKILFVWFAITLFISGGKPKIN